ncbi:prepilin peptidase [Rhodoluna limnophila]|uniref:prepilin peptidase n=1 Tax=Rhodoluna limnophila TaxID=232537 RepID=UPI0011074F21|nr:A24 family peptidase [Rhodoluna limnophila]
MTNLLVAIATLLGLAIGSFLGVVVTRTVSGQSDLVRERSHCPGCRAKIRWFDNVPLLSWVLLGGRCRTCRGPISTLYPTLEMVTAAYFGGVTYWAFSDWAWFSEEQAAAGVLVLVAMLWFGSAGIALAAIDVKTMELPDAIVTSIYLVCLSSLVAASLISGDSDSLIRGAVGCLSFLAVYGVLVFFFPRAMGMGDFKLSGSLGFILAWFGWGEAILGALFPFALASIFGLVLIWLGKAGRKTAIPFGPWMIVGTVLGLWFGGALWNSYLEFLRVQLSSAVG